MTASMELAAGDVAVRTSLDALPGRDLDKRELLGLVESIAREPER